MDSLRTDIEAELKRTRLDKTRLYSLLLEKYTPIRISMWTYSIHYRDPTTRNFYLPSI